MKVMKAGCLLAVLMLVSGRGSAELIMHTHGHITISPIVHGYKKSQYLYPGYRSEFMTSVDFFRYRSIVFTGLLGTTTIISDTDTRGMKLDRIRYTLTPGFRREFKTWLIRGALHHECIHTISRPEFKGSVWWNSFQIGIGTKEAYYLYLPQQYRNINNSWINAWDAQVNLGLIVPAESTIATGQNHDYNAESFSLVRYHIGVYKNWASFISLRQHMWMKSNRAFEHQINITANLFRKGTHNFAGFFYNYTVYDTFLLDNTDGLGSAGFRILF
ncbi:hypothetical protein LLG96_18240 [bacterium]|nr:hypothetical protein [bacterium]